MDDRQYLLIPFTLNKRAVFENHRGFFYSERGLPSLTRAIFSVSNSLPGSALTSRLLPYACIRQSLNQIQSGRRDFAVKSWKDAVRCCLSTSKLEIYCAVS